MDIIYTYAPEVRLHSEEKHFPTDVEWFMERCELCHVDIGTILSPVTSEDLSRIKVGSQRAIRSSESTDPSHFYFQIKDQSAICGRIDKLDENILKDVPVYAHIFFSDTYIDIQYFFFYSYNGAIFPNLPTLGVHEGDWEHITIRISKRKWDKLLIGAKKNPSDCIIGVYFASHGREGKWWLHNNGYSLNDDGRVIVYSSKLLHASYPTAGRQPRLGFGIIDDYTDNGYTWKTWQNIVILPDITEYTLDQSWIYFNGKWGRKQKRIYGENPAPYGPGMKKYFHEGEIEITPETCLALRIQHDGIELQEQ